MTERSRHKAYASAIARHVSAEGCQLLIDHDAVSQGQRFSLELVGRSAVSGAVRWVVGDCVGFAFDSPLGIDEVRTLQNGSSRAGAFDLFLIAGAQNSPDRP